MARASKTGIKGLHKIDDRFRIDLRYRDVEGRWHRYTEDLPRGISAAAAKERGRQVNNAACAGLLRIEAATEPPKQLHDCLDLYVGWCKQNRPKTLRDRRHLVGLLKKHIADTAITNVSQLAIERFKRARAEQGVKPATINRGVALWKHFIGRAVIEGWIPEIIGRAARNVTMLKEPPGRVRYLDDEEATRLLGALRPDVRDVVLTAMMTGMRRGEILGLKKSAVDFATQHIRLTETKTNKARFVPIHDALVPVLQQAIERSPSEYVFTNVAGRPCSHRVAAVFRRTVKKLGIHDLRFHDLRHDFATKLRRNGFGLDLIATLLGHTTLAMTQRYAHLGREDLRHAVRQLKPVGSPSGVVIDLAAKRGTEP